jgi:hypothetical protein
MRHYCRALRAPRIISLRYIDMATSSLLPISTDVGFGNRASFKCPELECQRLSGRARLYFDSILAAPPADAAGLLLLLKSSLHVVYSSPRDDLLSRLPRGFLVASPWLPRGFPVASIHENRQVAASILGRDRPKKERLPSSNAWHPILTYHF